MRRSSRLAFVSLCGVSLTAMSATFPTSLRAEESRVLSQQQLFGLKKGKDDKLAQANNTNDGVDTSPTLTHGTPQMKDFKKKLETTLSSGDTHRKAKAAGEQSYQERKSAWQKTGGKTEKGISKWAPVKAPQGLKHG